MCGRRSDRVRARDHRCLPTAVPVIIATARGYRINVGDVALIWRVIVRLVRRAAFDLSRGHDFVHLRKMVQSATREEFALNPYPLMLVALLRPK